MSATTMAEAPRSSLRRLPRGPRFERDIVRKVRRALRDCLPMTPDQEDNIVEAFRKRLRAEPGAKP
jgi:hypothetical protein